MRTNPQDQQSQTHTHEPEPGEEAEGARVVPKLDDAPERFRQDTRPMDGDAATHLPPETELEQKPKVQG